MLILPCPISVFSSCRWSEAQTKVTSPLINWWTPQWIGSRFSVQWNCESREDKSTTIDKSVRRGGVRTLNWSVGNACAIMPSLAQISMPVEKRRPKIGFYFANIKTRNLFSYQSDWQLICMSEVLQKHSGLRHFERIP